MSTQSPVALNSNVYTVAASTSNASATLVVSDIGSPRLIVYNDADAPAFVVSGETAPTAVFPTSATAPLGGSVVSSKSTQAFTLNTRHKFVSVILSTGTGNVYLKVGTGE